jgi:hypothetical protein
MFGNNCDIWIESQGTFPRYHSFRLPYMFFLKKKLSIEVANIYGVQINLKHKCVIDSYGKSQCRIIQECRTREKKC